MSREKLPDYDALAKQLRFNNEVIPDLLQGQAACAIFDLLDLVSRARKALSCIERGTKNISKGRSYGGVKLASMTRAEMQEKARALLKELEL
jgi:hypothetical protein